MVLLHTHSAACISGIAASQDSWRVHAGMLIGAGALHCLQVWLRGKRILGRQPGAG